MMLSNVDSSWIRIHVLRLLSYLYRAAIENVICIIAIILEVLRSQVVILLASLWLSSLPLISSIVILPRLLPCQVKVTDRLVTFFLLFAAEHVLEHLSII